MSYQECDPESFADLTDGVSLIRTAFSVNDQSYIDVSRSFAGLYPHPLPLGSGSFGVQH